MGKQNNLTPETLETLELIKIYAKNSDNWWLENKIEILEVQIIIEKNNAQTEVYKKLNDGIN
jgi:hypothetical protein